MPEVRLACTQLTGAASELKAAAWLIEQGYYVYRSESPAAPFDLVAYRDGRCERVEVKTLVFGCRRPTSAVIPSIPTLRGYEWDMLVVVGRDRVWQFRQPFDRPAAISVIRADLGLPPQNALRGCA